jgi:hypothetical protein
MKTLQRTDAAKTLIAQIDASGLDASLYSTVNVLRVYVKTDGTKKGKDCGYLQIERDGSITQAWDKRRFDLERVVAAFSAEHTIEAKAIEAPVARAVLDENETDQIESAARMAAREVA